MNNQKLYIIRLGEIALKGRNRDLFENQLKENIKEKLRPHSSRIHRQKGRLFLYLEPDVPSTLVSKALQTTFGIVGFAPALVTKKSYEALEEAALKIAKEHWFAGESPTFKVESSRTDKSFPLGSYEISAALGSALLAAYPELKVDVRTPDKILHVEIRDQAYLYSESDRGPGGLPVGSAGSGMLLLSGGIDSPVAGYQMAKRGLRLQAIYFHAYPYTSDEAKEKVISLARILAQYDPKLRLHVIPFTAVQLHIKQYGKERETTLMMRCAMVKIANRIARQQHCSCLITGEALSQVASQTVESLAVTDAISEMLVCRPLIGLDKEEIVRIAKNIGSYEISILPFEDCCTLFSPKFPVVKPELESSLASYRQLELDQLLAEAVKESEVLVMN